MPLTFTPTVEPGDVVDAAIAPGPYRLVPTALIDPSPDNPRGELGDIGDLAKSVAEMGVIMALVVRTMPDGRFEAICGHRRLAAATEANVDQVPVIVRDDLTDGDRLALMVEENRHRAELTAPEEARAFRRLIDDMGWTQQQVAQRFDTQQGQVSKRLKLLKLPDVALDALQSRSRGHSGGITVEQALTLADLPAAAVKDLFADGPPAEWKINNAKAAADRDRAAAARRKELEKAGVPIVTGPLSHDMTTGPVPVWRLDLDNDSTHAALPCHAVLLERGNETAVCTDPQSHAAAAAKADADDRKARLARENADKERQADDQARLTAQEARTDFLRKLLVEVPTVAATVYVARSLIRCAVSEMNYDAADGAIALLQVTIPEESDAVETLERMIADATDTELLRVGLAVALADMEMTVGQPWQSWDDPSIRGHFDFMVAAGYQPTPFEEAKLAAAAVATDDEGKDPGEGDVELEVERGEILPAAGNPDDDEVPIVREDPGTGESMEAVDVPIGGEGALTSDDGEPAPVVHETTVTKAGKKFKVTCSCGELQTSNTTQQYADTAAANHLKAVGAAQ